MSLCSSNPILLDRLVAGGSPDWIQYSTDFECLFDSDAELMRQKQAVSQECGELLSDLQLI